MILWAVATVVFTRQGVLLKRADRRLSQIFELIAANFPIHTSSSKDEVLSIQTADS